MKNKKARTKYKDQRPKTKDRRPRPKTERIMQAIIKDLRYGIRSLLKRPGFTAIAVITLTIGIGATTTIFSVVNGLLLRPLPGVSKPDRLADVYATEANGSSFHTFSYPDYLYYREQNK